MILEKNQDLVSGGQKSDHINNEKEDYFPFARISKQEAFLTVITSTHAVTQDNVMEWGQGEVRPALNKWPGRAFLPRWHLSRDLNGETETALRQLTKKCSRQRKQVEKLWGIHEFGMFEKQKEVL